MFGFETRSTTLANISVKLIGRLAVGVAWTVLTSPSLAAAQVTAETLKSLATPDKVETRIGTGRHQ